MDNVKHITANLFVLLIQKRMIENCRILYHYIFFLHDYQTAL